MKLKGTNLQFILIRVCPSIKEISKKLQQLNLSSEIKRILEEMIKKQIVPFQMINW
jgi:hypothetical protein